MSIEQLKEKYLTDEEGTLTYTDKGLELLIEEVKAEVIIELLDLCGALPSIVPLPRHLTALDLHEYAKANGISLQAK